MDAVINGSVIHILPDARALFAAAASDFVQQAIKTVQEKQCFTVVLSGGETPKLFFDTLVKSAKAQPSIPWQQIKFFFGDERYVPADDSASNYHSAYEHLFSKLPIPAENIYRMPTDLKDPNLAAEQYAHTLQQLVNNKLPWFDLVYLGLGADAHTASLMPENTVVSEYLAAKDKTEKWVAAVWVPKLQMHRLTLLPAALNNSGRVCFLVQGADKALAVWQVLQGESNPLQYPAQLIQCEHGETVWYLDQQAAGKIR